MTYNIIEVAFGTFRKVTSIPINYKFDIGQVLKITGLELPESYVVDFCNQGDSSTISMVGTADGVRIPDEFLQTGKPVKAYVVLSGEDNTQTRYEITIPVNARPERTDIQPTPEEQSTIDSLIAAMNTAVESSEENADRAETAVSHYPKIEAGNWYVWNPETGAYEDTGIQAEGEDGVGIRSATLNADYTLTLTFTDGTSYTTPSIRGEPGQHGQDGVSPTITVTAITGGHRVEITDAEGTSTFNVMDGETGATPNLQIGTVTTLPAGSDATAEITGTPEQPRLNLGVPEGQKGDPGEVTQAQLDTALANKADIITDTASGAITSFPDGADNLPLKSLVASIEPVQDLHGYDSPWPAGGGVNLLPFDSVLPEGWTNTLNGITATYSKGYMKVTGTNTSSSWTNIVDFMNVWISQIDLGPGDYIMGNELAIRGQIDGSGYVNKTSAFSATSSLSVRGFYIAVAGNATVNWNIPMMLVKGTTRPTTYSPYSNECPISGWTGVSGWRRGGNVIDWTYGQSQTSSGITSYGVVDDCKAVFSGTATATIGFTLGRKAVKNGETYTITVKGVDSTHAINCRAIRGDLASGGEYISMVKNFNSDGSYTFTCDGTYNIVDFRPTFQSGAVCNNYEMFFAITGGTNPASFESVNSEAISVNWQDSAGTVYGGTLAIDEDGSCKLTVDRAIVDLGTLNWSYNSNWGGAGAFYCVTAPPGIKTDNPPAVVPNALCTTYAAYSRNYLYNNPGVTGFCVPNSTAQVSIRDSRYNDAAAFKAAMSGVQLVYELAEPIEYQLDPVTLATLLGVNNIWVNTGDVNAEYRADTKLYIDKKLAALVAALS